MLNNRLRRSRSAQSPKSNVIAMNSRNFAEPSVGFAARPCENTRRCVSGEKLTLQIAPGSFFPIPARVDAPPKSPLAGLFTHPPAIAVVRGSEGVSRCQLQSCHRLTQQRRSIYGRYRESCSHPASQASHCPGNPRPKVSCSKARTHALDPELTVAQVQQSGRSTLQRHSIQRTGRAIISGLWHMAADHGC